MADKDEAEPTRSDDDASAELAAGDFAPDETESVPELEGELSEDGELESVPAEREPATVGAGDSRRRGSVERSAKPAPKGTPTARRDTAPVQERTTPARFVRQSVGELRKVVYPTGQQLGNYFVVVLVFVLFIIAYVSLLDLGLGQLVLKVFS